jgi:outer membrane lipoprotein-sorting protein
MRDLRGAIFQEGYMNRTAGFIVALIASLAPAAGLRAEPSPTSPAPASPSSANPPPAVVPPAANPAAANPPAGAAKPPKTIAAPAPKPFVPMDPAVAIQKANDYFNMATTMVGDFVQIGPDGKRSEGKIYVQRPGKLRFEYAQPATLEIVADGLSVAVHDRKTETKDVYFISQTPLKFLLKDHIDLNRDVKVVDVSSDPASVVIQVEDSSTFGGTSQIKLIFDPAKFTLKQWEVTDPQGYETVISLFNIDLTKKPDPNIFQLTQERLPNTNN